MMAVNPPCAGESAQARQPASAQALYAEAAQLVRRQRPVDPQWCPPFPYRTQAILSLKVRFFRLVVITLMATDKSFRGGARGTMPPPPYFSVGRHAALTGCDGVGQRTERRDWLPVCLAEAGLPGASYRMGEEAGRHGQQVKATMSCWLAREQSRCEERSRLSSGSG